MGTNLPIRYQYITTYNVISNKVTLYNFCCDRIKQLMIIWYNEFLELLIASICKHNSSTDLLAYLEIKFNPMYYREINNIILEYCLILNCFLFFIGMFLLLSIHYGKFFNKYIFIFLNILKSPTFLKTTIIMQQNDTSI